MKIHPSSTTCRRDQIKTWSTTTPTTTSTGPFNAMIYHRLHLSLYGCPGRPSLIYDALEVSKRSAVRAVLKVSIVATRTMCRSEGLIKRG